MQEGRVVAYSSR
jgi:hypothetical protein